MGGQLEVERLESINRALHLTASVLLFRQKFVHTVCARRDCLTAFKFPLRAPSRRASPPPHRKNVNSIKFFSAPCLVSVSFRVMLGTNMFISSAEFMGQINFPHAAADILRRRPIPRNHLIVAMHAEKDERNVIEITFAEFEMNIFRHARIDYR